MNRQEPTSEGNPIASATGTPRARYTLRPTTTPLPSAANACDHSGSGSSKSGTTAAVRSKTQDPFIRAASEDDDGYDPFSDRPPTPEPTYQEDPWR